MKFCMLDFSKTLQIIGRVISGVLVAVMNFIVGGDVTMMILPNVAMNRMPSHVMPAFALLISNAVKALMSVVDNFDGRRRGQILFENVEAVAFKIVIGEFAEFSEQSGDTFRIFHDESLPN